MIVVLAMAQSIVKHCIKKGKEQILLLEVMRSKEGLWILCMKSKINQNLLKFCYSNDFQSLCVHSHLKEYKLYQRKRSQL